jgi:exopolysaccharide production protein ExoQ
LSPTVTSLLGRDETFTGRTDIWRDVLEVASCNPLLGIGYGSFSGLETSFTIGAKEAHSGYLDVYLQLGIVGVVLLSTFLLAFCGKVRREINHVFEWGVFGICFLLMLLLSNISESSFITTGLLWVTTVFVRIVFSAPCLYTKVN